MPRVPGVTMSNKDKLVLSDEMLAGIKAGLNDIMQGCMTINKVITMYQIPESQKWPDGRPDKEVASTSDQE